MFDNIKSAELYKDNDQYYLRLKYIVNGSDNKKYELFIPRVRLPIEKMSCIEIKHVDYWESGYNLLKLVKHVAAYSDMNLEIESFGKDKTLYTLKEITDE